MATGALVNELFSNCTPETLSKKISECFREFDRDNSGGLDSEEIGRAFLLVGKPLKYEDILTWLKEFDADGP
jgi:Ca2+-binding EF-hand superfamily protein